MAGPAPTRLHLYTDGASQGNPGPSAAAWLILDPADDRILVQDALFLGKETNNEAEYNAMLYGLRDCTRFTKGKVILHSDSEFCIRQLRGEYRVKEPRMKALYDKVIGLRSGFSEVEFVHHRRVDEWIARCDKMAEEAIAQHTGQ
jgi:ribonuclease HI